MMRIQARTGSAGQVRILLVCVVIASGCKNRREEERKIAHGLSVTFSAPPVPSAAPSAEVMPEPRCPPDLVKIKPATGRAFCIDRYEAMLVDNASGTPLSPYFAPARRAAVLAFDGWSKKRFEMGSPKAQLVDLPELPKWQRTTEFEPRAVSKKGVVPSGYTSGVFAALACKNAGKRLCTPAEWRTACGGEQGWKFPYGPEYVQGKCNVFREGHPAASLHGNAAIGHTDPRLNRVKINGKPLLRSTGDTPECASHWGDDAVYDMVGNLDEWMDHETGTFGGGFFSRGTKDGCDWRTENHPKIYADYSTGVRCCADLP
jgi:formylglycine-generating enzyme